MIKSVRLLAGVVFAAIAMLLAALAPAGATRPAAPMVEVGGIIAAYGNQYGAMALSTADGAAGWSYDFGTKRRASARALRECKKSSSTPWSCRKVAWVRNGCLALAVKWKYNDTIARYAWGLGANKGQAYSAALNKCGWKCTRRAYTCTTR